MPLHVCVFVFCDCSYDDFVLSNLSTFYQQYHPYIDLYFYLFLNLNYINLIKIYLSIYFWIISCFRIVILDPFKKWAEWSCLNGWRIRVFHIHCLKIWKCFRIVIRSIQKMSRMELLKRLTHSSVSYSFNILKQLLFSE